MNEMDLKVVDNSQQKNQQFKKSKRGKKSNIYKTSETNTDYQEITGNLKIRIHKEIDEFLKSFDECLAFSPNLTKSQRAYVHNYVKKLGLISKSFGRGNNRYITLYKRINKSDKNISWLSLSPESKDLLKKYLKKNNFVHIMDLQLLKLNEINSNKNQNLNNLQKTDLFYLRTNTKIPLKSNCPKHLLHQKQNLPIYQYRKEILRTISKNQAVIINGDTGSGKTTQTPQYILEESFEQKQPCKIICTQPRRMAVVTISQRVAQERGEQLGNTIGFQIRLNRCYSKTTNLIYTTSGCFLRSLMGNAQETFNGLTHVIIDEIHERDKDTDFILISLRDQLIKYNKKLKIILMSATMDIHLLSNYFDDCKIITVPGKCYETKVYYLEEILYCTEYRTRIMIDYLNQTNLINALSKKCTQLTLKESEQKNFSIIELNKETQNYIDNILEQCFVNLYKTDEYFAQLLYLIESENISINVTHSKTNKTPLIVAAQINNYEYVEKFLKLNANQFIHDVNQMNAVHYSKIYPDKRSYNLLKLYDEQSRNEKHQTSNNVNIDEVLAAYQKQFNDDDEIDHSLLATLIKMVHNSDNYGSILVFLPGCNDIIIQKDELTKQLNANTYKLFLLHSSMKTEHQQEVLEPCKVRKIILSTNIGETSITFPDVVFVIDCGRIKINTYDSITGTTYLKSVWISKACAEQRGGRAGRTRTGICYRMYSRTTYESMEKFLMPELLRISLTEVCLYAKAMNENLSIASYLSNALDPPSKICIANSINKLKIIGALDNNENMTLLGKHLVDIPLEVQLGKCLLFSIWMKCLDPILTVVAYHSVKDPFILPSEKTERGKASTRRKSFCSNSFSDHIGVINLYQQWRKSKHDHRDLIFNTENYLIPLTLDTIHAFRQQIFQQIRDKYLLNDTVLKQVNQNSNNCQIIYSCLAFGLYPNICFIDRNKMKITSRLENSIVIHPSSTLKPPGYRELKQYIDQLKYDWIIYCEKTRINRLGNIRYNTIIPSIIIALFSGHIFNNQETKKNDYDSGDDDKDDKNFNNRNINNKNLINKDLRQKVIIDDWIEFYVAADDKNFIEKLKLKVNYSFIKFLKNSTSYSNKINYNRDNYDEVISIIKKLYKNETSSANYFNSYITFKEKN